MKARQDWTAGHTCIQRLQEDRNKKQLYDSTRNERERLRKFVSTQTLCGQEGWRCRRARRTCLSKPSPSLEIVLYSCEILPVGPAVGAMGFCSNLCGLLALVVAIIFGYMQTVECPGMRANDSNLSFSKTFD